MHKIVKGTEDHRLESMLEIKVSNRRVLPLQVRRMKTENEKNSLSYRGTIVWKPRFHFHLRIVRRSFA